MASNLINVIIGGLLLLYLLRKRVLLYSASVIKWVSLMKSEVVSINSKQPAPNGSIGFSTPVIVSKGWGREVQIVNKNEYAGKLLVYDKAGSISSMHFHLEKSESFYVLSGQFNLSYYDLENATLLGKTLNAGDVVDIPAGNPHQLLCVQPGTVIEFSTTDYSFDNYRIGKGDSQK